MNFLSVFIAGLLAGVLIISAFILFPMIKQYSKQCENCALRKATINLANTRAKTHRAKDNPRPKNIEIDNSFPTHEPMKKRIHKQQAR